MRCKRFDVVSFDLMPTEDTLNIDIDDNEEDELEFPEEFPVLAQQLGAKALKHGRRLAHFSRSHHTLLMGGC